MFETGTGNKWPNSMVARWWWWWRWRLAALKIVCDFDYCPPVYCGLF